jgi:hypothetical protein
MGSDVHLTKIIEPHQSSRKAQKTLNDKNEKLETNPKCNRSINYPNKIHHRKKNVKNSILIAGN